MLFLLGDRCLPLSFSLSICDSHNYLGRGVVVIVERRGGGVGGERRRVLGQYPALHFHWRWVPFFLVRAELIDFVNAFGDQ